jgi:hypothetical protein
MQNEPEAVAAEAAPSTGFPELDAMNLDIVDVTNVQVDVADEVTDAPPAPPIPVPETTQESTPEPTPQPTPQVIPDPQVDILAQQNAALQQQVNQWTQWQQQQEQERRILEEANATRAQLETQGYSDDQIEHLVTQQQAFQRREAELQANLQRTQLHEQGRYRAAMHYSKLHGVDADQLLPYNSPQEMELRAKEMSRIGQLEAKLAQYEKASVPPQNFDTGTSQVTAVSNEEAWLDRYNAGDRSPEALAAAKRAAGL